MAGADGGKTIVIELPFFIFHICVASSLGPFSRLFVNEFGAQDTAPGSKARPYAPGRFRVMTSCTQEYAPSEIARSAG
jgi:hypothetical protein